MTDQNKVIAIMGQGLMGAGMAHALTARGFRVITCLAGRSAHSVRRATAAGMEDVGSLEALAEVADVILSILPSSQALSFAEDMAPLIAPRGEALVYSDFNVKAPSKAEAILRVIEGAGALYVDGAITGPPPNRGQTNVFLAGPHMEQLDFLTCNQVRLVKCGADAIAASKLKLCISASTKARNMTYLMALISAKRMGIYNSFKSAQQSSDPAAWKLISQTGPRMATAARRWGEEFDEVAQMMTDMGLPPALHEGVSEMFGLLEASPLGAETKETLDPNRSIDEFVSIIAEWGASHTD